MTMTDLSPAAQAVMIAATNGNFNVVNDPVYKQCIAAALQAAAQQAAPEKQVQDISYVHQMYIDGMRDALAVLEEIAAELEKL